MDEDLKIVLTSELEADEQASAQRIQAQLPNISKIINSKSAIKVGVVLDDSNIRNQSQKVSQEISKAIRSQDVGVNLTLDKSSVSKINNAMKDLGVSPDVSRAMTTQLDQMGIQIDKISGRWETVNNTIDGVAQHEERLLNLTIQGTDQIGRSVSYLGTYNEATKKIETSLINVSANLEKQRQTEAQIAARAKADNEARIKYLNDQEILLNRIFAKYTDPNASKPLVDQSHLKAVSDKYNEIKAAIESLGQTEGRVSAQDQVNIQSRIANLDALAKKYQNVEYIATSLRTKTVTDVNAEQVQKLKEYEERLRASGQLTNEFQQRISELRTQLGLAFDSEKLTAYLNQFDRLKSEVGSFKQQISSVNDSFSKLGALEKSITSIKSKMLNVSNDSAEYKGLSNQLALQLKYQKEISTELGKQIAKNPELIKYASAYSQYLYISADCAAKLAIEEGKVLDATKNIDASMQSLPAIVQNIQLRFRQLNEAPTELTQKVSSLKTLMDQVSNAQNDAQKIAAYQKLQSAIAGCNSEITALLKNQREDFRGFKFEEGLKKAKADLAMVGRQWSALKDDPGLNTQFRELESRLNRINSQDGLNRWTAEFSRFKSEVKAAGKNMQSFFDIMKNNVGKVAQWIGATNILFRTFRLLRSAINTIVELNTSMVDLKKVTDETDASYRKFYRSANDTAKQLGVTTNEVISQTAEWARLGYTMSEAAELAKNSAIFEAISPGMDIEMATDGLVSVLKAFDEIGVDNTLDGIISKINDVGNKFAVSNKDIVEVMTRSSSAMKAANNTFEESVALATAAVEITRDATSVGQAMKTVSMRVRGYDEELEEYSNDIYELTGKIADLTKVTSNGNRGVSLFEADDPDTYRSTYDILKDIADIWEELTDKNQAQLLEVLFGKRQGQIGAAILSNFEQAEKVITTMESSAGSAGREMEKIYDSLEYKLNRFKETGTGIAQNIFDDEALKDSVDALTAIASVVDVLTDKLGLLGTIGFGGFIASLTKLHSSVGGLKNREVSIMIAPTYALVVTRNELAA